MEKIVNLTQIKPSIEALENSPSVKGVPASNSNDEFMKDLKGILDKVSEDQVQAQTIAKSYEVGEESSIAKVMVAQQVSSLGFNMVLNVRNKVLSAYRDIINMPV